MRILVAMDSFKGSLTAAEACRAVAAGIVRARPEVEVTQLPISDGGDGLLMALSGALSERGYEKHRVSVQGPLGEPAQAELWIDGKTCIMEMAQACGLTLIAREKRSALRTTSFGLGQAMGFALQQGCTELFVGLGGSATNDLGLGAMQALGCRFQKQGRALESPVTGADLAELTALNDDVLRERLRGVQVTAIADVTNPLLGERGATRVFGPQKGGSFDELSVLEEGMQRAARLLASHFGFDVSKRAGAGAAGGMGAALMWFTRARMQNGAQTVLDLLDFDRHLAASRFLITGEGCFDSQSQSGKAPWTAIGRALEQKVPVALFCGALRLSEKSLQQAGIGQAYDILSKACNEEEAMQKAASYLEQLAFRWAVQAIK